MYSHELDLPGIVDEFLSQSYEVENNQSIFKWNENKWKKLKEVIENKRTEPSITGKEAEIISELFLFVVKIERYFSDLEGGIKPLSAEVIFDGPSYLLINTDFFRDYFKWNGNQWSIK